MTLINQAALQTISLNRYQSLFSNKPTHGIVAPGRINLIGEHTDYSDGFALPVAINRGVLITMAPIEDKHISLYSIDFSEMAHVDLTNYGKGDGEWKEFIKGIVWALEQKGHQVSGWQGVISGNLPIGAGLSSSAATEIALITASMQAGNIALTVPEMARLGRKAEQDWVGVNVGIMDQLISAAGKRDHALLLDCKTMDYEYVHIPEGIQFIVLDTKTRRELSHSAYNTRQNEVQRAASLLEIPSLREGTPKLLKDKQHVLPITILKRARHVITENQRVMHFCKSMKEEDIAKMGALINESHNSLRDDYEVSSDELNTIVEIAREQPGCFGARMTGAGFGGCALAIVASEDVKSFEKAVFTGYLAATGIEPHIFSVESSDGAHIFQL